MNRSTLDDIVFKSDYFGSTIGRFALVREIKDRSAFRIKKGTFPLNGTNYSLATNSGNNHNHGGIKGFDKVLFIWIISSSACGRVTFGRKNSVFRSFSHVYLLIWKKAILVH